MYPQGQQNSTDHTANFFWLIVLICLAFLGIWFFKPEWVVDPIYALRYAEIELMLVLSQYWAKIAPFFHLSLPNTQELHLLKNVISQTDPKLVPFSQFASVNSLIGHWVRWPVAGILVVMAFFAYFRHATLRFRQTYTMDTLKKLESENWPQIEPVISLDLVSEDPELGPWAMAKTPLSFCKEHDIVSLVPDKGNHRWVVDQGPASRLFAMQLGPLWRDLFNLPIHVKAMIVIFVAKAEREHHISKHFLSQIARSAASGKLDFTGVNEQLLKYQHSKLLAWLRPRHAYVLTMMASLLKIARSDGVLATAEFLWLKPVDRRLWYTLNSVGRQTAVVEVSGVFAHWRAEMAMGRAMTTPMIKEAVKALEEGVKDILYEAEDNKWRSNEA